MKKKYHYTQLKSLIEKKNAMILREQKSIISQAAYLYYRGDISKKEFDDCINSMYTTNIPLFDSDENYIENILINRFSLSDFYDKVIPIYDRYVMERKDNSCNEEEIKKQFIEFLKYIGCKDLYDTINQKDMIAILKEYKNSSASSRFSHDLTYIIIRDRDDRIEFYSAFAHEMGHAFYNNVLCKKNTYHGKMVTGIEIPSILVEKLFLDFLLDNSNIDKDAIKDTITKVEDIYSDLTRRAKFGLDILNNPKASFVLNGKELEYEIDNKKDTLPLSDSLYAIGDISSDKLLSEYDNDYLVKHLRDICFESEESKIEKTVRNNFDVDAVDNYLGKHLIKKK